MEEQTTMPQEETESQRMEQSEELYEKASQNEEVRARILGDYFSSMKGVPLMTGAGVGVAAPVQKPKSIKEAGKLALGYLKNKQ